MDFFVQGVGNSDLYRKFFRKKEVVNVSVIDAVAFVADNPGSWLFHCHILGHARAGMMSVIRVT